jgi:hypothetical protein
VLAVLALSAGGCVAEIHEERLFGGPRTIAESRTETMQERTDGASCRPLSVTYPVVRDVTIRRSFADDAQTRNLAMATLFGAGIAFLAYGTNQTACNGKGGACPDFPTVQTAEGALLALAAIPIGFAIYNAIRVQDSRAVEYMTPRFTPGAPVRCAPDVAVDARARRE